MVLYSLSLKLFFKTNKHDVFCFYKLNSIFVARISNILNLKIRYYVTIRFFKKFPVWTESSQDILHFMKMVPFC